MLLLFAGFFSFLSYAKSPIGSCEQYLQLKAFHGLVEAMDPVPVSGIVGQDRYLELVLQNRFAMASLDHDLEHALGFLIGGKRTQTIRKNLLARFEERALLMASDKSRWDKRIEADAIERKIYSLAIELEFYTGLLGSECLKTIAGLSTLTIHWFESQEELERAQKICRR